MNIEKTYATLLRSESFDGIRYIKSFIKSDKESIVTNETVDFENIKIDKQYPYAAMLLRYYRRSLEDHKKSVIDMLNTIYYVELAIDSEESRRIRERNNFETMPMISVTDQAHNECENKIQLCADIIDGIPVLRIGTGDLCAESNIQDKEEE